MTVGFIDGELMGAMPLATATAQQLTPENQPELATALQRFPRVWVAGNRVQLVDIEHPNPRSRTC